MLSTDKDKINRNRLNLIQKTKWSENLEEKLLANGVYKRRETMNNFIKGESSESKAGCLYESVLKRGPHAYKSLVKSLIESDNFEAAQVLDDNVEIPKTSERNEKVWSEPSYEIPPPLDLQRQESNLNNLADYLTIDNKTPIMVSVKKAESWKGPPQIKAYPMHREPRGYALIIDNEEFDNDIMPKREGSLMDANNLDILFQELGFKVILRRNLGYNELISQIMEFSTLGGHANSDMAVVAILSHGDTGLIFSKDGRTVPTEWLLRTFNNDGCPALKGKPKFFIFQACRGDDADYGYVPRIDMTESEINSTDAIGVRPTAQILSPKAPTWEDMLIAYATVPGYVANRNLYRGTWFVESICRVFMEHACHMDIREMLDEVSDQLRFYESEFGTKQSCSYEVRHFYKKLFFNPGLTQEFIENNFRQLQTSASANQVDDIRKSQGRKKSRAEKNELFQSAPP